VGSAHDDGAATAAVPPEVIADVARSPGDDNGVPARRLAHVLWNGKTGGLQRSVYQLLRQQLRDPQLAPAVVFAQGEGPYVERTRDLGCEVIVLNAASGHAPSSFGRAVRVLSRFELHHFHSAEVPLMLASLCCPGASRYYTHRGGMTKYPPKQRLRYSISGPVVRRFTGLSGNTAHAAASAAELMGIDPMRFAVTYNGLDFDLLEPQTPRSDVRRRLELPNDAFVLGTAAHLRRWKRVERLIDALAAVDSPTLWLLIVGYGDDLPRLKAHAVHREVDDRVLFAGEQDHIGDYLQLMDAFCLASTGLESFGNAAVEAMAMGIPTVVFSDGGGLLEHVDPGRTALVVDDVGGLAQAIERLMRDGDFRVRIGSAGRAFIRQRYTLEAAALRYRELYGIQSDN
jgi:glycosyltransferase involved in cell wall biosynthesis